MPDPGPLAAELAAIRERASQITDDHDVAVCIADLGGPCSGHDAERLADVVERVLARAARWEAERGHPLSEHAERTSLLFAAKYARVDAGVEIREAITSKLLSEGEGDDG